MQTTEALYRYARSRGHVLDAIAYYKAIGLAVPAPVLSPGATQP